MYSLDDIIKQCKEELKDLITKYAEKLNNKQFQTIYDICYDYYIPEVTSAFTALLLKNNINPLRYMTRVPKDFVSHLDIEKAIIPYNIKYIYNRAFSECENLKWIHIPKSIQIIGYDVFTGCKSLTDVYYEGSEEDWEKINIQIDNEPLLNANIHYNS